MHRADTALPQLRSDSTWVRWLVPMVLLVAWILRIWATQNDFWLDEVWVHALAGQMDTLLDAFTRLNIEHHYLVTIYFYILGDQTGWGWYRVPMVVTGSLLVPVMALAVRKPEGSEALMAVWLTAFSFPLVQYASEARGYAPAALFSVLAFIFVRRHFDSGRPAPLALFWLWTVLALLSQLTAIFVYAGIGFWSLARAYRAHSFSFKGVVWLLKVHLVPTLFLVGLYLVSIRRLHSLGGPWYSLSDVVGDALAYAVGAPTEGIPAILGILAAGIAVVGGLVRMYREHDDAWLFYATALLVAPAVVLVASGREFVHVRYFTVILPFFYLAVARALVPLVRISRAGAAVVILLFTLFTAGSLQHTAGLLTFGRGAYLEAIGYMVSRGTGPEIHVGSDHDLRNGSLLAFYGRYLPAGRSLVYHPMDAWPKNGVEWVIVHDDLEGSVPYPVAERNGVRYELQRTFPFAGLSGFNWHIYRNAGPVIAQREDTWKTTPEPVVGASTSAGSAR